MTAFVNGAISAFNKVLDLINILDPEHENPALNDVKNQINIYIAWYEECDKVRVEYEINDQTWQKILDTSKDAQAIDKLKKLFES